MASEKKRIDKKEIRRKRNAGIRVGAVSIIVTFALFLLSPYIGLTQLIAHGDHFNDLIVIIILMLLASFAPIGSTIGIINGSIKLFIYGFIVGAIPFATTLFIIYREHGSLSGIDLAVAVGLGLTLLIGLCVPSTRITKTMFITVGGAIGVLAGNVLFVFIAVAPLYGIVHPNVILLFFGAPVILGGSVWYFIGLFEEMWRINHDQALD